MVYCKIIVREYNFIYYIRIHVTIKYISTLQEEIKRHPSQTCKAYVEEDILTHFCPPLRFRNQFLPILPTFAVRETDVSRTANVGRMGKNWLRKRNGG